MTVMPANASGWFWHCLARETGRIGHLYSPDQQRGPWPWFPYALDNGAYSCWNQSTNTFEEAAWKRKEEAWRRLLLWAQSACLKPLWSIVPDVPGNGTATIERWQTHAPYVVEAGIPLAVAVQDGMMPSDVANLYPVPEVICVGGTTKWKWETVDIWAATFSRVHLLRCNSPDRLPWLKELGVESCDGTGWNRGDRKQTSGLERWARENAEPRMDAELWNYVCRVENPKQLTFA